ncbi:MAG: FecR domain-containing protein, partial [Burkholderiales bacterium]|nr:FecR domain-containing protein [Burkholderiales bacterium]
MKFATALLASLLALYLPIAAAAVLVEAVQSPAWVERDGRREPLAPGMQLDERDRVVSGRNARVLLRMPEGSLVKLGEEGRLALDRIAVGREAQRNVVTASLDVLQGAFRFTTQVAARFRGERRIDIRIATVTAGIRGTDVWGKAAADRDIVCLIEGDIAVQRQG